MSMTTRYSLAELDALPTLAQGQADDLKLDGCGLRVWLSRVGIEDGAEYDNNLVTVERFDGHAWQTVEEYPAR